MPIVIVGNKLDKEREIERLEVEATVQCDWENGYAKKTTFNIIQGVQEKCHIQIYKIICKYISHSFLGMLNVAQCATQIFLWFLRKFSIRPDLIFAPCLTSRLTMDYWQSAKQGKDRKSEKFFSANKIEELALMDQSQVRKLDIRSSLQKEAT